MWIYIYLYIYFGKSAMWTNCMNVYEAVHTLRVLISEEVEDMIRFY